MNEEIDPSIEIALETLSSQGISAESTILGQTDVSSDRAFQITRTNLVAGGRLLASGSGKGFARQSIASSLFEAVENFYMIRGHRSIPEDIRLTSLDHLASHTSLRLDGLLSLMQLREPKSQIGTAEYQCSDGSTAWIPICIGDVSDHIDPIPGDSYDYQPFLRYMSTNGIASGMDEYDSVLHGILEVVERDSVSRMLMGAAGLIPKIASVLQRDMTPVDLTVLSSAVERACHVEPTLYSLPSFGGTSVVAALAHRGHNEFAYRGAGASLWLDYATERALSELWQDVVILDRLDLEAQSQRFYERLRAYPFLQRAMAPIQDDLVSTDGRARSEDAVATDADFSVQATLKSLVDELHHDGFVVYHRVLHHGPPCVVHVYIPGMERFLLATRGNPMVPTGVRSRVVCDERQRLVCSAPMELEVSLR